MKHYSIMFKYFVLVALLVIFTNGQDISDFTSVTLKANYIDKISLPQYISEITMSFISVDGSLFSAYLLDSNIFIIDYSSDNYSNGDLLNGHCAKFLRCNKTVSLDSNTDYVIVIDNNNLLEDGTIEYYLDYSYDDSILIDCLIIFAYIIVPIMIIVAIIVIIIKKCV